MSHRDGRLDGWAATHAGKTVKRKYGPARNYACEHRRDESPCSGRMEWHHWSYLRQHWGEAAALCRKHHMQWHKEDEIVRYDPDSDPNRNGGA